MPETFRFISWNLQCSNAARTRRQLAFLAELKPDLVALQEVSEAGCDLLESLDHAWRHATTSRPLRPAHDDETASRRRFCAILATERLTPIGAPAVLENSAAPGRSVAAEFDSDFGSLSVGSFHQVAGSDTKKWGPEAKARSFRAIAAWLAERETRAIAGMDVNSPKIDHPDITRNEYF